jgi:hypothetical protein
MVPMVRYFVSFGNEIPDSDRVSKYGIDGPRLGLILGSLGHDGHSRFNIEETMIGKTFYSISDAARLLGKEKNRKLLRILIRQNRIPTHRVGSRMILDEGGVRDLRAAVEVWDRRPRLSRATMG